MWRPIRALGAERATYEGELRSGNDGVNVIAAFGDMPSFALKAGIEAYFCHRHATVKDDLRLKVTNPKQWDADLQQILDAEMSFKKQYQTIESDALTHALIVKTGNAIGLEALPLELVAKFCLSSVLASMRISAFRNRKQIAEECRALATSFPKIIDELTRAEQVVLRGLIGSTKLGRVFGIDKI